MIKLPLLRLPGQTGRSVAEVTGLSSVSFARIPAKLNQCLADKV